jgi:surface polysaccharide O-acyltransferase-like enzyme
MTNAVLPKEEVVSQKNIKMKEKSQEDFLGYGDWVRLIGTFAVVMTHCMDFILYNPEVYSGRRTEWWVANTIDAATRWAVPVYIMLSGAILLAPTKKSESIQTFYKKRLTRVGLPLLFWIPFFIFFALYITHWQTPAQLVDQLLYGEPYGHLHFVVRILGLYAITPMLRVFTAHAPREMLLWTIVVTLGMGAINSTIDGFTGSHLSAAVRFVPFIGFYLVGYYLRNFHLNTKTRFLTILAFILSLATTVIVTGFLVTEESVNKYYPSIPYICYDFLSVPRIIMGISAWLLLTDVCRNLKQPKWLASIAGATFGIYLIHPLFKDYAVLKGYWLPSHGLWPNFFIFYLGVYVASAISILLILKIPLLKRVVG